MPSPPNIDGLPIWLQIAITLCFGIATLVVAFKGYFRKEPTAGAGAAIISAQPGGPLQQVQSAAIMDMVAIRNLSDACLRLAGHMESLEQAIRDQTHWTRTDYELNREVCARLRELREALERRG